MANYQRNTAYNLNTIPNREKAAQIKTLPRKRAKTRNLSAFSKILVAGIIVFMLCFNLGLRVKINNVKNEISTVEQEIEKLESEAIRLEMKLENKISYDNIEEVAQKMGMQKIDKEQIHYIDTTENDTVEILNLAN